MAKATCSIDGCDRPRYARGWCRRHYDCWQRRGTPFVPEQVVPANRRCVRCDTVKPLDEFEKNPRMLGGRGDRCRACRREQSKAWRAANAERVQKNNRRYYEDGEGAGRVARYRADLRDRDPEKYRRQYYERNARRRAQITTTQVERIDVDAIVERDGSRCWMCHRKLKRSEVTLDHLIPLSAGGPHIATNLRVACLSCNCSRGPGRVPAQLLLIP